MAYTLFDKILGDQQYVGEYEHPSNRLFNQFHASQTDEMKKEIVKEIVKDETNLRVLFLPHLHSVWGSIFPMLLT